jgi:hypothetical protein
MVVGGVREARADGTRDPRGPEPPVMVFSPPPPPPAPPSPKPEPSEDLSPLLPWGGALSLGALMFRPDLGGVRFTGQGVPLGQVSSVSFSHLGRQIGILDPFMGGGQISLSYYRRYVAFGIGVFLAGNVGGVMDVPEPYRTPVQQVSPSDLSALGGMGDLSFVLPLGPASFKLGGVLGLRQFSVPMSGFEKTTCRSKHGTYPCDQEATSDAQAFFEPRARVDLGFGPRDVFFVGAYVGMELVGGSAPTAGVVFGIGTPHASLQP